MSNYTQYADTQVLEPSAVEADSPMLVNGRLAKGSTGLSDPVINPATGEVFAHVPHGTEEDLNEAVEGAKQAYKTWSKTPYEERAACLVKYGELLLANADRLAEALSKEQGKPLAFAKAEIMGTAADCKAVAQEGNLVPVVTKEDDKARWELQYIPRGVVGGIAPWNFPISTAGNKIHPAVITGNTVVLKPSPYTPLATAMMSELAAEAFPAGVVNIVTGSDDLGQKIVEHPDICHITFTGSARTGQKIMATAAMHGLKKVTLELGGNDAAVVRPRPRSRPAPPPVGYRMTADAADCRRRRRRRRRRRHPATGASRRRAKGGRAPAVPGCYVQFWPGLLCHQARVRPRVSVRRGCGRAGGGGGQGQGHDGRRHGQGHVRPDQQQDAGLRPSPLPPLSALV
jgi:hypothetical protein